MNRENQPKRANEKQVIVHPILFALYPTLFLYGTNAYLYDSSVIVVPALVSLAAAAVLWVIGTRVMGDSRIGAIFTSLVFLIGSSFGPILDEAARSDLAKQGFSDGGMGTGEMVVLGCVAAAVLASVVLFKFPKMFYQATYAMNVIGTVLLALPLVNTARTYFATYAVADRLPEQKPLESAELQVGPDAPDIYHIVLDGYGRNDVFEQVYGYDNSYFTDFLKSRGFYIADQANANYSQTVTALPAALNMNYLDTFVGNDLGGLEDRRFLRELAKHNRAVKTLREAGYRIFAYESAYYDVQIGDPDVLMRPDSAMHPFYLAVLDMTPIPWIMGRLGHPLLYDVHRARMLHALRTLPQVAREKGPKLVYTHLLAAHPPFVFERDGSPHNPQRRFNMMVWGQMDEYLSGYRDQVEFINNRLMETIDGILKNSERPPVIFIHGDHGPGSRLDPSAVQNSDLHERMSILNAYLIPCKTEQNLYPQISPVNSYRYIFDACLGGHFQLLPDKSYVSDFFTPYNFIAVNPPKNSTQTTELHAPSERDPGL